MKTTLLSMTVLMFAIHSLSAFQDAPGQPKFAIKIKDEKAIVVNVEGSGAIDPMQRIRFQSQGNFNVSITTMENQPLHLGHGPMFMINNQIMSPGQGGRFENVNAPLPKTPSGKPRNGFTTTWVANNNLHITNAVELIPSKARGVGQKRLMDTVLVSYHMENKGTQSQTVGARLYMDTYVVDNDGCLFAAPTIPKQILNGMILKDKTMPAYLQMLQRPDLQNPGYVAHMTFDLGGRYEKAKKVYLSRFGSGYNGWEMQVFASMGDSAITAYWDIKELKPGAKRDVAYAYGAGVAVPLDSEGRFQLSLGGSFEPGKIFTVRATVADPTIGQSLALELPPGMERVEGKEIEPVTQLEDGQEFSSVLWKARVLRPGDYSLRVRSSTGVTQSKLISITPMESGK